MKRLILYSSLLLGLFGCKTYEVMSVSKTKIIPGVATATPNYEYTIDITVIKKEVLFKEIKIGNNPPITTFGVYNQQKQTYTTNKKGFSEGKYTLTYKTSSSYDDKEEVKVVVETNAKTDTFSTTEVIVTEKKLR